MLVRPLMPGQLKKLNQLLSELKLVIVGEGAIVADPGGGDTGEPVVDPGSGGTGEPVADPGGGGTGEPVVNPVGRVTGEPVVDPGGRVVHTPVAVLHVPPPATHSLLHWQEQSLVRSVEPSAHETYLQ